MPANALFQPTRSDSTRPPATAARIRRESDSGCDICRDELLFEIELDAIQAS
jgi:hypothetical protein